jgi:hypothetical protein
MTDFENQVIETWNINNRINLFMIENIPEEALKATLSIRGGRDISRQLAHVNNVRVWRLKPFAKKISVKLTDFDKGECPDKKKLINAFKKSGEVMRKYLEFNLANGGAVSNFRRGVIPMLGYYISHEAHHRGNILLTMKKSGFPLSAELSWEIWEWNKI